MPKVATFLVAALVYGGMNSFSMVYPVRALQCGFEAMTPIILAGCVHGASKSGLYKWKQVLKMNYSGNQSALWTEAKHTGKQEKSKMGRLLKKSCRVLQLRSGQLFGFSENALLAAINDMKNQTVNLLVSFPN